MSEHKFKQRDFESPSALFILEDILKSLIGCPLLYNPYFKTFRLKGNEKVLDFGCGGGAGSRCLINLLTTDGHLTCVDTSNYWINKARKRLGRYPNVECKAGDIRKLDIPNHSLDVISIFHVIHDIAPQDRQDIVNALSRLLKANGTIFIRERIKESHGMPIAEIRTLFSNVGLSEVRHTENKSEYSGVFNATCLK